MAIPTTGPLSEYATIGVELGVAQTNVSLRGMSQTAGFAIPDAMSEFYGYSSLTPSSHFNTVLYTGNGSQQSITGVGFQPDFVWIKARNQIKDNQLYDSNRGFGFALRSNTTDPQQNYNPGGGLNAFNLNGFSLNDFSSGGYGVNGNGINYVAWCWKAGGAAITNTNGTISSQVSANTAVGFSVVKYTPTLSQGQTVGHGLGTTPNLIIVKRLDQQQNWIVNGNVGGLVYGSNFLYLDDSRSLVTAGSRVTAATNTTFTLGSVVSLLPGTYVAYCFAAVSGYSSFGSYTGTGVSGNTITTGFLLRFIIVKSGAATGESAGNWHIFDSVRGTSNFLFPNTNAVEGSYPIVSFTSTGFALIDGPSLNENGRKFVYMAFA